MLNTFYIKFKLKKLNIIFKKANIFIKFIKKSEKTTLFLINNR